jgi:hypothetical protein
MAANAAYLKLGDVVLPIVGLSNIRAVANWQTTLFLAWHGLSNINDFGRLEPNQAKDLVKQCLEPERGIRCKRKGMRKISQFENYELSLG